MSSAEVHLSWEASASGSRPPLVGAAPAGSAAAVSSQFCAATAHSSGIFADFLSEASS